MISRLNLYSDIDNLALTHLTFPSLQCAPPATGSRAASSWLSAGTRPGWPPPAPTEPLFCPTAARSPRPRHRRSLIVSCHCATAWGRRAGRLADGPGETTCAFGKRSRPSTGICGDDEQDESTVHFNAVKTLTSAGASREPLSTFWKCRPRRSSHRQPFLPASFSCEPTRRSWDRAAGAAGGLQCRGCRRQTGLHRR